MNTSIGIIILVILTMLSAYFSATETAFASINRVRLKNMANTGNRRAAKVLELSEDYNKILSTILIGNNIVNIALASISTVLFVKYYGDLGITISTIVMTVVVLIFGEISPKSMAKEAPESFAMFVAPTLHIFVLLFTPINYLFAYWKKLLTKLFKPSAEQGISEEELITIVQEAQESGSINEQESTLIRKAIEFNDICVGDVLTHRTSVVAVSVHDSNELISAAFDSSEYSRLPIYKDNIDQIIGFINIKDFYRLVKEQGQSIEDIVKPTMYVTKHTQISKLLKNLQQEKLHLAVVVDEYGGTVGIVTLEDIVEEIVGEIWDEHDEVVYEIENISEHEYKVLANVSLEKISKLLDVKFNGDFKTLGGWLSHNFTGNPYKGGSLIYGDIEFVIDEVQELRIVTIMIKTASNKRVLGE